MTNFHQAMLVSGVWMLVAAAWDKQDDRLFPIVVSLCAAIVALSVILASA